MQLRRAIPFLLFALTSSPLSRAGDDIPKAAWKRSIGAPLDHPGTKKPTLDAGHIDDGYWQGAPVGGFGAGTFSRTYRGDFAAGTLKGAFTNISLSLETNLPCFSKGKATRQVLPRSSPLITPKAAR